MSTAIDTTGQGTTPDQPGEYTKAAIAVVGSGLFVILTALSTGGALTPYTIISGILAAITVIPVWRVSQKWWGKAISAGVVAALQVLLGLLSPSLGWGAVSGVNWAAVFLAFITAAGVGIIPNTQPLLARGTGTTTDPAVITNVPKAAN